MFRALAPLLALAVLGACQHGSPTAGAHYVLRVDQRLDRSGGTLVRDPPPDASFRAVSAYDAYTIDVEGDAVRITPLDGSSKTIGGHREASAVGEERFTLDAGLFAGGRLVLRGDRGELTIFGSGVPIVSSDRGALVRR